MGIPLVEKAVSFVRGKGPNSNKGSEAAATQARLEKIRAIKDVLSKKAVGTAPLADQVSVDVVGQNAPAGENGESIGELLKRRQALAMFLNSSDSTGTSRIRDAAEMEKIDKSLQKLGYASSEEKKAA